MRIIHGRVLYTGKHGIHVQSHRLDFLWSANFNVVEPFIKYLSLSNCLTPKKGSCFSENIPLDVYSAPSDEDQLHLCVQLRGDTVTLFSEPLHLQLNKTRLK